MEEVDAYRKNLVTRGGGPFSHSSMKQYKVFRGGLRRKRECCFSFPGSPFTLSPLARVGPIPGEQKSGGSLSACPPGPAPAPSSKQSLPLALGFIQTGNQRAQLGF